MPWCPVCKNEYKAGYTICADCNTQLVNSLEEVPAAVYFGDEKELQKITEFLHDNEMTKAYVGYDEKSQLYEIFVPCEQEKEAKRMIKAFLRNADDISDEAASSSNISSEEEDVRLMELASDETFKQIAAEILKEEQVPLVYQNKHEKAEEYRSSAWALLIVGILGLAFLIVNELGILPFTMNFHKGMVYGVMGTVFVLFILIAVYSFSQTKKILTQADEEDTWKEQIHTYLTEHFGKEQLMEMDQLDTGRTSASPEAGGDMDSDGSLHDEENLYFTRTNIMKEVLKREFEQVDKALIEQLVDDYYDQLFS